MRYTWLIGALALAACGDTGIRQVGPGNGQTGGGSTPFTGDDDDDDGGGTTGGEGSLWSCDRRSAQGICEEYIGEGWDEASITADCSGATDTLQRVGCPLTDIGGCDETRENPEGTLVWYYQGQFFDYDDAANLQAQCTGSYYDWVPY